jgi:hypothetical protein
MHLHALRTSRPVALLVAAVLSLTLLATLTVSSAAPADAHSSRWCAHSDYVYNNPVRGGTSHYIQYLYHYNNRWGHAHAYAHYERTSPLNRWSFTHYYHRICG